MKKDLKRQIKRDDFASGIQTVWTWFEGHQREARTTAVVVVVLAVATAGLAYFQQQRSRKAQDAFAEALAIFEAPVRGELAPGEDHPGVPVYSSADEKWTKAAAAFDGVERRYGSLPIATRARYYAGLSRMGLKDYEGATKDLNEVARRGEASKLDAALARLALAQVARQKGQLDSAAQALRLALDDGSFPMPKDAVLMDLGSVLEQAKRSGEAVAAYRQLSEQFPQSVYAAEARRRAAYLDVGAEG